MTNEQPKSPWVIALNAACILGVMAIMAGMIWIMYYYTQPGPVDDAHWIERKRNLSENRAHNAEQLDNYAWIDRNRGLVRLPAARATALTIQEWQDPAAGRASLLARLEKATPPLPVAPAATNAPAEAPKK